MAEEDFAQVVGRISFFVNAGLRFVTEMCKMRAFTELWDEITAVRYGVDDPKLRRFRYGVQVNSLGLTEQQPENNVYRILLEMLAVVLSKNARARAVQLPAWNEALGLPRPWDQQWSIRMQQIVAYETDLLEYADVFDGSKAIEKKVDGLKAEARQELARIEEMGGAIAAIPYMKQRLVESNARRVRDIETGDQVVVGVNRWRETEPSPLAAIGEEGILTVPQSVEREQIAGLEAWREGRDAKAAEAAIADLKAAAKEDRNVMEPSLACAKAGVTTGEWGGVLREVFGQYRAPTGISSGAVPARENLSELQGAAKAVAGKLGRPIKFLVGKPGLDGHSNGAEQIALRARDCGMEVIYEGIRLTPSEIVAAALEEDVDVVGLSILSGSHVALAGDVAGLMREKGLDEVPLIVGGIIPADDQSTLEKLGVAAVYTPKDFELDRIMADIVALAGARAEKAA